MLCVRAHKHAGRTHEQTRAQAPPTHTVKETHTRTRTRTQTHTHTHTHTHQSKGDQSPSSGSSGGVPRLSGCASVPYTNARLSVGGPGTMRWKTNTNALGDCLLGRGVGLVKGGGQIVCWRVRATHSNTNKHTHTHTHTHKHTYTHNKHKSALA